MASHRPALLGLAIAVAAATAVTALSAGAHEVVTGWSGPVLGPGCHRSAKADALLAVTASGDLDAVNLRADSTTLLASGVTPDGGVAVRPELDVAYVTAPGPGEDSAIWSIPLGGCQGSSMVAPDALLPSVSPDGGHLGYVTLNGRGQQTGVAVVRLATSGRPVGRVRAYRATSVPPPLPITAVAVGRMDASLAVGGGVIDRYLGKNHPTVSTLDPQSATSLGALVPVFDEQGISIPDEPSSGAQIRPEDWQSSPTFRANGEFLVGDHGTGIVMPYASGPDGGGIRSIATATGPLRSLAAGPAGALAWVGKNGRLTVSTNAVDLPFGPAASTPPRTTAAPLRLFPGQFTSVAWTAGPAAETAPTPRVFQPVANLPSVVGLPVSAATTVMAHLDLPVLVGPTVVEPTAPAGTVLAQNPPAGDGVACQCVVVLTVSATS
jgi:hypothetical protein